MPAVEMELGALPSVKKANGHSHFTEMINVAQFAGRAAACRTEEEARALIIDTLASLGYAGPLAELWTRFPLFAKKEDE